MAKFAGSVTRPTVTNLASPVRTTDDRVLTHEGGVGFERDAESELFLLAATNMVAEDTFYESAAERDDRYTKLVHQVVQTHPEFVAGLAGYLRTELLMRSASVVLAAEYVAASGPNARKVVDAALQRADEPSELVGYWLSKYGRRMPMALRRGVADAVRRLYTERGALRFDGAGRSVRMADVVELIHPKPVDARQSALFRWLIDERHHRGLAPNHELLPLLFDVHRLNEITPDARRDYARRSGTGPLSWEQISAWLPGGMDAEAWGHAIDQMGAMALVRNLRNFDAAGISDDVAGRVVAKITDAEQVRKARLFPYQVWSAYQAAPSDRWRYALGKTLDLTVRNVPQLDGTLVVIDTSASMEDTVSGRSKLRRIDVAAVMGVVTTRRSTKVDLVIFGQTNAAVGLNPGGSALRYVEDLTRLVGSVGHSTYGHTAIAQHFNPAKHRRVVLFTDDQQADAGMVNLDHVPTIYTFNLGGYRPSSLPSGRGGRHSLGGFSDATFTLMRVLEEGHDARWPFLAAS